MSEDAILAFDLSELIEIFGEPSTRSRTDLLYYWFDYERADGGSITLTLDGYERSIDVIVQDAADVASSHIHIQRCGAIRVLEVGLRTAEIVSDTPPLRCFLALDSDPVLDLVVPRQP